MADRTRDTPLLSWCGYADECWAGEPDRTKCHAHLIVEERDRLREGIRRALDILDQVHLYDSPEYEELEGLLPAASGR